MSLISVNHVNKAYFSQDILIEADFTLEEGDRLALIGENGSGKTTLMRIIAGEEKPDSGSVRIASGLVVSYLSQQMEEFTDLEQTVLSSSKLARLEQELQEAGRALARETEDHAALLRHYQQLSEAFENAGGYSYLPALAQALAALGIKGEALNRPIASLSGGERMRVLMARRLLERADVLLLDEPTNHLDINGLEWLEAYLQNFKGSVIFISHDRYFIEKTATRTAELTGGKLYLYKGAYTAYLAQKEAYTRRQEQHLKRLCEERERQLEVKQTMLSHRKMNAYHAREKVVAKLEDKIKEVQSELLPGEKRMSFRFTPKQDKRDAQRLLLELKEASVSFAPEPPLFSGVSVEMRASDKKVLVGPNGCGKSTLLAMVMGRVQNFAGELSLVPDLRYGHLGQYTEFADEQKTVLAELMERSLLLEEDARNLLARYGFRDNDVYKEIAVLSGGERARLYLCCLLEEEPDILFLDEPTNHLDIHSREILEDAIIDFNGAVLAVSHDRYFIEKCGFDVLGFIEGGVRLYESYASYRHFARISEAEPKTGSSPAAQPSPSSAAAPASESRNSSVSRAESPSEDGPKAKDNLVLLRSEAKSLSRRFRQMEDEVAAAEAETERLESLLDADKPETYAAYAAAGEALEALYEEFFALGERIETLEQKISEIQA